MADRTGVKRGETVILASQWFNQPHIISDTDTIPKIEISLNDGTIIRPLSSANVTQNGTGRYEFSFYVPLDFPYGPARDRWLASVAGVPEEGLFQFTVLQELSDEDGDGEPDPVLGDLNGVEISYSNEEIKCLNKLMKVLDKKLFNQGEVKKDDGYGGKDTQICSVFSVDQLVCFLEHSLATFNAYPHFSSMSFCSPEICGTDPDGFGNQGGSVGFSSVIIEYAYLSALIALLPLEAGRQWTLSDDGVVFNPPPVSDSLNTVHGARFQTVIDQMKFIKLNLKPSPISLGSFTSLGNQNNPAFRRLRHLRSRRIV